jgi:hypothetical protein
MEIEIKKIILYPDIEKERKSRIISLTNKWKDVNIETNQIKDDKSISDIVKSEIRKKISGYKSQDIIKKMFCKETFIDYDFVIELLKKSLSKCFYCDKDVFLIYEFVREPRQWTIERIDNTMGHNKDNVEIACLHCNLRRRTMYYKRYLMTKRLIIKKIL